MGSGIASGRIDAYDLDRVVGRGGMAVVFAASEPNTPHRYALKALTGERALESRPQRQFRREVQALARLNHPAIARVYDFGEVDDEDRVPPGFDLEPGSPWLTMEHVEGRDLGAGVYDRRWRQLESLILTILDALAHAHADGILHRDLKPSNILVAGDEKATDVRLVDFGIAQVYDAGRSVDRQEESDRRVVGTPNYMAPEQIRAQSRRQGPWTDLYSLGAVIWVLVTGMPPFDTHTSRETLEGHLRGELPAFDPAMPVPDGLEAWLQRMLQKSPEDRFQRAADAAWGLLKLGEPTTTTLQEGPEVEIGPESPTLEELEVEQQATRVEDSSSAAVQEASPDPESPAAAAPMPDDVPPLPGSWQRGQPQSPEESEEGALLGKRLLGLRRVPLVDREEVRTRLWTALARVSSSARPEAVVLEGPEGLGKSRLADWCLRRAHELGSAQVFEAQYSRGPAGHPQDGLGPMLARYFRCVGLSEAEILEELAERERTPSFEGPTGHHDRIGLASLMARTAREEENGARFSGFESREERYRLAVEAILETADRRAAVVWLDDVPHGEDPVEFCRYVFDERAGDRPILFILTADDEPDEESASGGDGRLREFCRDDRVDHVRLDPLSVSETERLVGGGLGLDPQSAEATAALAEGNPLFAIELVRHWAETDRLVRSSAGLVAEEDAFDDVPDDARRVWVLRLYHVLGEMPAEDREAVSELLVLGAELGRRVREREWRRAAEAYPETDFEVDRLLGPLVRRGLLVSDDDGWEFAHGLLREALTDWFDEGATRRALARACAEALVDCYGLVPSAEAERTANYFLEAGDRERALTFFELAADWYLVRGSQRQFERAVARYRTAASQLADEALRRRAELRGQLLAYTRCFHERSDEGREDGQDLPDLLERADRRGWNYERALAHHLLGFRGMSTDGLEDAIEHYRRAIELIDTDAYPYKASQIAAGLGAKLRDAGDFEGAREAYRRAREITDRFEIEVHKPAVLSEFGYMEMMDGHLDRAESLIDEALESSRQMGARSMEARAHNMLGELHRERGEIEEARSAYETSLEQCAAFEEGSLYTLPMINLAIIAALHGRAEEAEGYFWGVAEELPEDGHPLHTPASRLGLAYCAGESGEWEQAEKHLREARRDLERCDTIAVDFARLAEHLADVAERADRRALARRAYRIAEDQRRRFGDGEQARKWRERRETLSSE